MLDGKESITAEVRQSDLSVNIQSGTEVNLGQLCSCQLRELLLELSQVLGGNGETGCLGMTAKMMEQAATLS